MTPRWGRSHVCGGAEGPDGRRGDDFLLEARKEKRV